MPPDRPDPERILALEMDLGATKTLLTEQREADRRSVSSDLAQLRSQVVVLASSVDKFALAADLDKDEQVIEQLNSTLHEIKEALVPRAELQARLDGIGSKQESLSQLIERLGLALQRLSDEWEQQEADAQADEKRTLARRNIAIAAIAAAAAVSMVLITLFSTNHTVYIHKPPAATTTVVTR